MDGRRATRRSGGSAGAVRGVVEEPQRASLRASAGLGPPADPTVTPDTIKPEWYFYFSFRLLKLTSLNVSVVLTGILLGGLLFWPFIESWLQKKFRMSDSVSVLIGVVGVLCFLVFTVWESIAH